MTKRVSIALFLLTMSAACHGQGTGQLTAAAPIEEVMRRVCDWQLANRQATWTTLRGREVPLENTSWIRAVFFTGVMATYRVTGDERYRLAAMEWGRANQWALGPRRHADDHCAAQVYLELHGKFATGAADRVDARVDIEPLRARFDAVREQPRPGRDEWSWCDALFMEPPAWAKLSHATGEPEYLDSMDDRFWDVVDHLYDAGQHLFYRDARYLPEQRAGGPVFWGRGNGWVAVAITRILDAVPAGFESRERYEALLVDMCTRIASLAQVDGRWGVSLLEPDTWNTPETSASALFCAAIAWGIRHELLSAAEFGPVLDRAWSGVVSAIQPDGRVAWVQLPSDQPRPARLDTSMEYGAGAVLLAAEQMFRLRNP